MFPVLVVLVGLVISSDWAQDVLFSSFPCLYTTKCLKRSKAYVQSIWQSGEARIPRETNYLYFFNSFENAVETVESKENGRKLKWKQSKVEWSENQRKMRSERDENQLKLKQNSKWSEKKITRNIERRSKTQQSQATQKIEGVKSQSAVCGHPRLLSYFSIHPRQKRVGTLDLFSKCHTVVASITVRIQKNS